MDPNQKLTGRIAGRVISGTSQANDLLTITFDDGSKLKINTAPSNTNTAATGGKVLKVRQNGATLNLDLDDGSSLEIETLRDDAGAVEYAG